MNIIRIAIVASVLLVFSGCAGSLDVTTVEPLILDVVDRHDKYVNTGKGPDGKDLSENAKAIRLRSSNELRRLIKAAKGESNDQ